MNYFGRIVSGIKGYYSEINSATLTGAIDIIVVRQADGSYIGSPFHVRFGKIGVLRSREKVVDISINDEPVDLHMKLGEAGEAFFVEPCAEDVPAYLCTSPIPDAESLMSEGLRKLKQEVEESGQQMVDRHAEKLVEEVQDSDIDSGDNDIPSGSAHKDTVEADFVKRSSNISVPGKKIINNPALHQHVNKYYPLSDMDSPVTSPGEQSPLDSQSLGLEKYLSDTEVNYQCEKDDDEHHMTWNWGRLPQGLDSTKRELKKDTKKPIKKHKPPNSQELVKDVSQGMYLEDLQSVDQEVANLYLQQAGPLEQVTVDTSSTDVDGKKNVEAVKSDAEVNKSDGESGMGSSVSVSPDETIMSESEPYSDVAMSLCGGLNKGKVLLEQFMESMVTFNVFSNNPAEILTNPDLVVRIDDKYYSWNVAVPMLISHVVYQTPLPKTSVDALVKEHMPKKSKRRGYSWFSWRSPPEHNESTDEEGDLGDERWPSVDIEDSQDMLDSAERLLEIPENNTELELLSPSSSIENFKKVLELSSEQLASLNLREGSNDVTFSVTTKYQGTASCSASIFLYNYNDKIIISDIDGTITKSDVLGQILPASFWAQSGVAKLFTSIQKNGYKFMYLSARPIGQSELTRQHLKNVVQENLCLPNGPLFLSPSSLIKAFHREVIEKRPEDFKIPCLRNIRKLFPSECEPFYAGFGNRSNDVLTYRAVGIRLQRIYTVNHKGEVRNEFTNAFQSSYTEMQDLVDQMFAPFHDDGYASLAACDKFSTFTYWRAPITQLSSEESAQSAAAVVEEPTDAS